MVIMREGVVATLEQGRATLKKGSMVSGRNVACGSRRFCHDTEGCEVTHPGDWMVARTRWLGDDGLQNLC